MKKIGLSLLALLLLNSVIAQSPPPPSPLAAPFCEDFSTGQIPSFWSQSATTGGPWLFTGNPGYDALNNGRPAGSYAWMDFSGTDVGVSLEIGDVDISALASPQLSFDHFSYYSGTVAPSNNDLFVEVWDGTAWNTVLTRSVDIQGWQNIPVSLAGLNYTPTLVRVRFRTESGGSGQDFYLDQLIDNVCFEEAPSCPEPIAFVLNSTTVNDVNFGWTDNAGASNWQIEYGSPGFAQGTGTSVIASTNPYTLSGLSSSTNYEVYIRAICASGDTSAWLSGNFSTPLACGDTASLCYDNNNVSFDNFTVDNPGDWIQIEFISGTVENTYDELTVTDGPSGTGNILYNLYGNSGDISGLVFTSTTGDLSFGVISDFSLSCVSGFSSPILYTINCFSPPTCFEPISANAFNIGEDSAFIAINDTNSIFQEFIIEYGPIGFTQGSGTLVSSALDTTLLSGLFSNTTYEVYITTVCSAGDTANPISISFTTECDALVPVTLPYEENFESTTNSTRSTNGNLHCAADHRWEFETTGGAVYFGTNAVGTVPTGLGAFTLDDGGSTAISETNYVILNLDLSAYSASTILELYFDYIENGDETDIEDRIWIRGSNIDPWVEVYNWTIGPSNTIVNVGPIDIDDELAGAGQLPSSTFQVRFGQDDNFTWAGGDGVTFDNVIITENNCPPPDSFAATSPNTDATVTWINPAPTTQEFILEYGPAGFSQGSGTIIVVPGGLTSTTITGLAPFTSYDVYIQTVCSAVDSSRVAGPISFITGPTSLDAAFIEFLSPNNGCGNDSSEVIAVVANLGFDTISGVLVDVMYGPAAGFQDSLSASTGILAPGQLDTLTVGYINTLSGYSPLLLLGTVEFLSGQDEFSLNDTAFYSVEIEAVPMPVAIPNYSICLGDSVNISLTPDTNGVQTMFYLSDTSTASVAMGDTVTFSPSATTTYYAQRGSSCYAVEEVASGGALNSTLTSFNINGLPGTFPSGATIIVSGYGDIDGTGGNLEQWNLLDENGNLLGTVGGVAGTAQCGDTLYDTVSISAAQMAAWNADGVIQFSGVDAAGNINTTLCGGDFLTVRIEYCGAEPNTAYTVSGGCASDLTPFLIEVNNPTLDTVEVEICEGTSYALPDGSVVAQSGFYTDVLSTEAGCDSVIVTNLTVNAVFSDTIDIVLCDGDGFTLANGVTVYDSGFYAVNLQTFAGCDSLLAYNVSIVSSFTIFQSPVICDGQSFIVGGTPNPSSIYTQNGAYIDTLLSSGGCDSIVHTNLSVLPEISIDYGNIGASICESDSVIDLDLLPIGGVLAGPGVSGNLFYPNVAGLGSHNLTYTYTDTTAACFTTANVEVDVVLCTGIENIEGLTQLTVFPIPFNNLFGIELEAEKEGALTVSLYDAASQLVYCNEFSIVRGANTLTLEVGALQAAGVYMLELERDGMRHVIEVFREE